MQLKFLKTLVEEQEGAAKIAALAWSPNNVKLAVATSDRTILLFDEQGVRRDKFSTKPVDSKYGKKSYVIMSLAFSPDSTKLAIGQSDNIVFVYKIGQGCLQYRRVRLQFSTKVEETGKKIIKIAQFSHFGTSAKTLLSGHVDGSIVRYSLDLPKATDLNQGKVATHPCAPYVLVSSGSSILAAGCDKRLLSYSENGRILQQFDYSLDEHERDFTEAVINAAGQAVVLGSFDRLRVFNWNQRRGAWDEGKMLTIPNLYTITALAWKPDGSRIACGTLCGNVQLFDCCLKRGLIHNKFETTHVGPAQVIIKDVTSEKRVTIRSATGDEIVEIKVMGRDRYVVSRTERSLLLADLNTGKSSEVAWQSGGHEKFYFDNENVCMIFNAGELTLVEYGIDGILGSARTEFMNPHLISVRLNERKHKNEDVKRMAYLIDLKTISILDLRVGTQSGQVDHDTRIDWLELNETGRRLLFRDKRLRLNLYELDTECKTTLLSHCSYVQWVPGSDVVVAQSRDQLFIWYNENRPVVVSIRGEVQAVVRDQGVSQVLVLEGNVQAAYQLDEGLIEFGSAMDDEDLGRAVAFLEQQPLEDSNSMWRRLCAVAMENGILSVAERCFAAVGDVARVRFLAKTRKMARQAPDGEGTQFYAVRARLAIMARQFKQAEWIYLEQNRLNEAIDMYRSLHKWDEAVELAEARVGHMYNAEDNHPDVDTLKAKYNRHLADTGQDEKAGDIKAKEGDLLAAIDLYLKGNLPLRAVRLLTDHPELLNNTDLVQSVVSILISSELHENAGELFEKAKDFDRALQCYRQGLAFSKAVELARYSFPDLVVQLEEEWGDRLVQQKQMDAAINHFIESGNSLKALNAAIRARQWNKAVQIVDVVDDSEQTKEYFGKIAEHYASIREYDRAERFYIEAGLQKEAIEMYNRAGKWQQAHRLASEFLGADVTSEMYLKQAEDLEARGRLKEAEELYIVVGQSNRAIAMYKKTGQFEPMMRLVQRFHKEHVQVEGEIIIDAVFVRKVFICALFGDMLFDTYNQETHKHLGGDLEEKGRLYEAEQHYLDGGDWKSAVNMYRAADQWEDAYRVARKAGGDLAHKQVAYLWAKSLGGDSAVKLLVKFNLLDEAIDFACDNGAFDFAFDLCRMGLKTKMPSVHLKYALQLEEDGQFQQAEAQFLQAGKPKEAVLMYVHQQEWDEAQRLAEFHCPDSILEVYMGQARIAFEQQDFPRAESYLLRANKPELILRSYQELGMWTEAFRVCKDYLPSKLAELQTEYEREQLQSGAKGALSFVAQGKNWEDQGDYERAVGCYMRVVRPLTDDLQLMLSSWTKIAMELKPELQEYVDEKYKESLKSEGKARQLVDVDALSGIELYIEKGQWDRALETAKQQKNPALLNKYVALRTAELMNTNDFTAAISILETYGAAANVQNFNLYKRLIDETMVIQNTNTVDGYTIWAPLRNMLLSLVVNLEYAHVDDPRYAQVFSRYLTITHYLALRSALLPMADTDAVIKLATIHLSVSLLRHCDLIPADKAFYEAGEACKTMGDSKHDSMAFIFLNHYLDLVEAIEEQNADCVDNTYLEGTDIPTEFSLPEKPYLSLEKHEEIKEWVLAMSVDTQIEKKLIHDERHKFESSLIGLDESVLHPCIITGYPVLGNRKTFGESGKVADREAWNKFLMVLKTAKMQHLDDVHKFIAEWTKTSVSMSARIL